MITPVADLDLDIVFLKGERDRLMKIPQNPYWVTMKIDQYERAIRHLEQIRREIQMTGPGGRRIEDPDRPEQMQLPTPDAWEVQK